MIKLRYLPLLAMAALMAVTACKTTEANYRAAYETVREHQKSGSPTEGTVYNRYRNSARTSAYVLNGRDTVEVRTEAIGVPTDGGVPRDSVMRYNVVVGGFKQIFNAKAMRDRLIGSGYKSFVINTQEPLYYVVAATTDSLELADETMKRVMADPSMPALNGYPFILQPVHRAY